MDGQTAEKIVEAALHQLGEHFEAVQILVTWKADGDNGTHDIFSGTGNWYSRQGMAHEFIRRDTAQINASEIKKVLPNENGGID